MIDIKSFSKPKKSGNGSGGSSSSVTYISGIASEADHATRADKAKKAEVAEQANVANRASSAQTASYASKAGEVDIESETLQKFLRKDDPAEGEENVAEEVRRKVTFRKDATFEQSAVFKEAADMLKKFTAHELAAFLKGFTIAGQFGIDEYGDMILNTIKSLEYNNAAEQGFSIEKEDPNRDEYHQYITNLTVWGKMTMNELEVMKRTYAGGTIYLSPAGGKIAKVVPVYWDDEKSGWKEIASDAAAVGWKCYLLADDGTAATENLWREGDQVRCQTMGRIAAGGIGQGSAANKSYWRTILEHGVSQQNEKIYDQEDHELFGGQRFAWIVIGKHSEQLDEYAEENAPAETRDIPEEGDVIVLDGSRTDPDRQNVLLLESHGSYAPRLVGYHGIDSYSHANKDVCDVSPKGVQVRSEYFKLLAQGSNTSTVEIPNFRGAWNAATQYYKNDQVSHNNAIWTCLSANNGTEPTDGSRYWRKEVYGMKGDKGDKGDKGADGADGIDGTNGTNGANGEDAISILVEDAPLIFDAGSNGIVPSNITKSAKVKVMKGNVNVTNAITAASSNDEISVNCKSGVTMRQDSSDPFLNVDISGNNIGTTWLDENDHSKGVVSVTSGYATCSFTYNNKAYKYHVPFEVNVSKFTGQLILTTEKFSTEMSELSGKHNTLSDNYDRLAADLKTSSPSILTNYTSQIEQTARQISLTVSEKAMGRRNMLPGSAFRKGDDGFEMSIYGDFDGSTYTKGYRGNQGIFMNGGVSGSNFFRVKSYYDGSEQQYGGLFWRGGGASKNIKVQANKKYVLSCWVKCDRTDVTIALETIYNASETTMTRPGRPSTTTNSFHVSKANTWQLISCIVTTDGSFNYVEVNFWVSHKINGVTATACFCHPMFEEAEEYNGWTLSKLDYDYIGGNLIDNSRTFASGGNCNVRTKYGSVIANGYNSESSVFKARMEALAGSVPSKYSLPSSASSGTRYALDSDWSVWQYNGNSLSDDSHYNGWQKTNESLHQDIMVVNLNLELNKDYIISWYAKCEGKGLFGAYAADVGKTVYSEYSDGGIAQSTYGENIFFLTTQWKRFWMHVKLIKGSCSAIIFRQYRGDLSSGSSAMTVYFTQPKIEEGATVTDWTEKRTDMVDRQALLATGIDITNGKITITANNTIFRDNNGTTIALFANGKINASLIDADQIEVKHLWAKSNDGASKVGYFGNTEEEACKIDDTYAPLFVGADTAKNSPFYVTNKGHMVSKSATLGSFSLNESSLRYLTGYDDEEPGFALYNEYMVFRGYSRTFSPQTKKWTSERNRLIWVGRNDWVYSVPSLMSNILVQDSFPMTTDDTAKIGLRISVTGCDDKYQYENVMYNGAMGSNVYGNFAIYAENGMYAGFRPMTRRVNYSMKLTELDCVIYVSVTGITLTLPDNPQRGQCYKFIQGSGVFYIKSSSKNIYSMHVGQTDNFTSDSYNQITEIIWIGDHWRINWFRESVGK